MTPPNKRRHWVWNIVLAIVAFIVLAIVLGATLGSKPKPATTGGDGNGNLQYNSPTTSTTVQAPVAKQSKAISAAERTWNKAQALYVKVEASQGIKVKPQPMPKGWSPNTTVPTVSLATSESVYNVVPLDGNTIRVYMSFTNGGSSPRSFSCVINTTVDNQFGDFVNIHTNSTGSNGNVQPGKTQNIYQDLGVDNGDAQYVTKSDVKLVDC